MRSDQRHGSGVEPKSGRVRHTNEMYDGKEEVFVVLPERHSATEMHLEELRNRVARLTKRESSAEASIL